MNWGHATNMTSVTKTINYNLAYTSNVIVVVLPRRADVAQVAYAAVYSVGLEVFSVKTGNATGSLAWIGVGH